MYKDTEGKVAGVVSFIEELGVFGTDIIPTFTLTWVYTYILKKEGRLIFFEQEFKAHS